MNLISIYNALSEPQLLDSRAHANIVKLLDLHARGEWSKREGVDGCGSQVDLPQAELIDGIGYIPVGGPLGLGLGKFEKGAGCTDYDDIEDDLETFEADPECKAVMLCIDSPGGMVNGLFELCNKIQACEKPVYAFTRGSACSAAYALMVSCDETFAAPSADVGCMGCYIAFNDVTEAMKANGIKTELFASGKYKGMGHPGVPLTADQRQLIQDRVNALNASYQEHILNCRGEVSPDDMQGQTFIGSDAEKHNLVDAVVQNLDEAVLRVKKENNF